MLDSHLDTLRMELKSIRVVVEARNVALPEYQAKLQENTAVCYVPSKAGAVSGVVRASRRKNIQY